MKGGAMTNQEIVVQKYGGSSIATLEQMARVAEHIKKTRETGKKVVVVVSARGDMTDELIKLAETAYGGELPSEEELQDEENKLLVTGEEQSAPLLALSLGRLVVPAISLTSREIKLETGPTGKVKMVKGVAEIKSHLDQGKVVVVTGYQGIKETTKMITVLGRGGSDVTEVALAAALGQGHCENYTDVDGIYATDPRIVPGAKRLEQISYGQLIHLAGVGGGKLNDRAVILAQNLGVDIRVMLSPSFGESTGGTLVCSGSTLERMELPWSQPAMAVRKLGLAKISNIPNKPGIANKILEVLSDINLESIVQPPAGEKAEICLLFLPKHLSKILSRLHGIRESGLAGDIKISEPLNVADLTLVDPLMKETPGYAAKVSGAMARVEVNIEMLSAPGATIEVVVKEEDLKKAAQALAEEFQLIA